ncbi:hypothetical protein NBRC10512_006050 [Rhodotorula toruloides]|uniref:RHTO0S04e00848g1_1 n=2 Tax=Rhodotorula toruloides TaxID=5286 RepID=A0A061ANA7_RHOTO|nr:6-coumarate-CoA ligase [Rhodotorula toruloides NP11]EMS20685.1 6-coumarate-CoA ligase [Rhodotorula toruloides NP11]CDR39081.1 RHTO0S04e00848g1_1 [Rhodotorula toruloides]
MASLENTAVRFPSVVKASPLPHSSNTAFEFLFSQPFRRGTETWKATPKDLQKHAMSEPIPPEKTIFRDGKTGATLSFGRLYRDALTVASSLTDGVLNLRPAPLSASDPKVNRGAIISPVVLLHLPNCLPFVTLAYGVLASGLTLTAANPVLTPQEIAHILTLSQPAAIVTTASGLSSFQQAFKLLTPELQAQLGYPTKGNVFLVNPDADDYGASALSLVQPVTNLGGWTVSDWKVLLSPNSKPFTPPKYTGSEDALRAAMIFWSSGTSGKSKGVILTHRAIGSALIAVWHASTLGENERLVGLPPFYHIFGWANVLMVGVAFGATVTTVSKFDPVTYLKIAQESRATHLHFSPPIAVLLAKSPLVDGFNLSSVRGCTSGGAPLATSVIEQVYKRLGILIKIGYGLSETGGATQQQSMTWEHLKSQLGSCGPAYPATELMIRSVETGKPVNVGEEGEVLIRSVCCTISYLNNPEATAESFTEDGWFCTGDIGKLDPEGNLYITDRLKELIKVKGFQVSPAELEDSLCASPLVQDAGVTSVYHQDHATEYPRAYVVPFDKEVLKGGKKADEFAHALRRHVEGKHAPYKWIRGGFVLVDAVPKSPAGKILRRLLKDCKGHNVSVYEEKPRAKL